MIFFRVDGNPIIGAGHIMRCLSIANMAKNFGETCLFIVSSNHFQDFILENGHEIINLNSDYSSMEPGDVLPAFEIYDPSVVFVDSYFVTEEYLRNLHIKCNKSGCKLVYIDDRCVAPYCCDYLLNYNIFGKISVYSKIYLGNVKPKFILGTLYTPLRKEFSVDLELKDINSNKNILVSTGGSDSEHLTIDIIEEAMKETKYIFHFVVGIMNLDKEIIEKKVKNASNIVIHENVKRMDILMAMCDVAISAAGSTLYELCAMRVPTITYVLADNQILAAKEFDSNEIMKNCGDIRELGNKVLASRLVNEAIMLIENFDERKKISEVMKTVVDGKGAERILELVLS